MPIQTSHLARTSGFQKNGALNAFACKIIQHLDDLEAGKLHALHRYFLDYYQLTNLELNQAEFIEFLKNIENPQQKEALLSPVLRKMLGPQYENNASSIESNDLYNLIEYFEFTPEVYSEEFGAEHDRLYAGYIDHEGRLVKRPRLLIRRLGLFKLWLAQEEVSFEETDLNLLTKHNQYFSANKRSLSGLFTYEAARHLLPLKQMVSDSIKQGNKDPKAIFSNFESKHPSQQTVGIPQETLDKLLSAFGPLGPIGKMISAVLMTIMQVLNQVLPLAEKLKEMGEGLGANAFPEYLNEKDFKEHPDASLFSEFVNILAPKAQAGAKEKELALYLSQLWRQDPSNGKGHAWSELKKLLVERGLAKEAHALLDKEMKLAMGALYRGGYDSDVMAQKLNVLKDYANINLQGASPNFINAYSQFKEELLQGIHRTAKILSERPLDKVAIQRDFDQAITGRIERFIPELIHHGAAREAEIYLKQKMNKSASLMQSMGLSREFIQKEYIAKLKPLNAPVNFVEATVDFQMSTYETISAILGNIEAREHARVDGKLLPKAKNELEETIKQRIADYVAHNEATFTAAKGEYYRKEFEKRAPKASSPVPNFLPGYKNMRAGRAAASDNVPVSPPRIRRHSLK